MNCIGIRDNRGQQWGQLTHGRDGVPQCPLPIPLSAKAVLPRISGLQLRGLVFEFAPPPGQHIGDVFAFGDDVCPQCMAPLPGTMHSFHRFEIIAVCNRDFAWWRMRIISRIA